MKSTRKTPRIECLEKYFVQKDWCIHNFSPLAENHVSTKAIAFKLDTHIAVLNTNLHKFGGVT